MEVCNQNGGMSVWVNSSMAVWGMREWKYERMHVTFVQTLEWNL